MNYQELETNQLEELKLKAFKWLKENENHPRYMIGLNRYKDILAELRTRKNRLAADCKATLL